MVLEVAGSNPVIHPFGMRIGILFRAGIATVENLRKCVAEAIGTFYFCFAGIASLICIEAPINMDYGLLGVALAHGLALSVAVCTFGGLSGAHFNPAVTCGMLVTRRICPFLAIKYILSQLAGATLAALVCKTAFDAAAVGSAKLGIPLPAEGVDTGIVLLIEFVCTFLLVTAIFGVAVDERGKAVSIGGFAIGLTVTFNILAAGALTGASMNPARSLGPALVHGHWEHHALYWIAPIAGAIVAALLCDRFLLKEDATPATDQGSGGEEAAG